MQESQSSLVQARVKAQVFQEAVEKSVKRLDPIDLAAHLSVRIEEVLNKPDLMAHWPIHFMMHAIEASCAYFRKGYQESVRDRDLINLINVYHAYYDPTTEFLLTESNRIDLFFAMYARQQFYLQEQLGQFDAARGIVLFNEANYAVTSSLCELEFGFSFKDWITFGFGLHAGLLRRTPGIIGPAYFNRPQGVIVNNDALPNLFQQFSASVSDLGRSYVTTRKKFGNLYDPYFLSSFMKRPLLEIGNGDYLAPHKGLVLRRAVEGLFDLAKERWTVPFGNEFGLAFERYVGQVLNDLPSVSIFPEEVIRRHTEEKMCDYIISGDDFLMFVECKAIEYSASTSSEGAALGDNSSVKIATAVEQLISAARLARGGQLQALLGDVSTKTMLAIVVTYRHIYQANSDLYWKNAIAPNAKDAENMEWEPHFGFRPQTMDASELEQLAVACRYHGFSPHTLFADKLSQSDYVIGEWETYLSKLIQPGRCPEVLQGVFTGFVGDILAKLDPTLVVRDDE